jgi:hypothetical protein
MEPFLELADSNAASIRAPHLDAPFHASAVVAGPGVRFHPYSVRPRYIGAGCPRKRSEMNVADCIVVNTEVPSPRYENAWDSIIVPSTFEP